MHDDPSPQNRPHRRLDVDANLFDFFHEHVGRAVEDSGVPVSREGVWYLTGLLVDRAHRTEEEDAAGTLVELRVQASEGDRTTAISAYRRLGDRALMTAGFFRQSIARKLVSRQYYIDMGAAAYDALAGMLRAAGFGRREVIGDSGGRGLDVVYDELAQRFEDCSEVLAEVHHAVRERHETALSDSDILALYEEWLATGSPRVAARLTSLGVVPVRGGDGRVS
ncbi:MAG: hypothetical protein D6798_05390 [Deltaproteobacteria bacterium]|nr:MAG: hypothetical protein D6798_05390 [Deltaproteobacteria bacterium]